MKEPIKNKLQKILLEIGFSAKEADVYLARALRQKSPEKRALPERPSMTF